jgi:hypothetical protein
MSVLEIIGVAVLFAGAAYCGWRALLLGAVIRQKMQGKPKPPITILGPNPKSK